MTHPTPSRAPALLALPLCLLLACGESPTTCGSAADCAEGEACVDGVCRGPSGGGGGCATDAECDDGIDCTSDRCMAGRCRAVPDHLACPAGALCSAADGCVPGQLCETDVDCDDGVFCDGAERCIAGRCAPGDAVDCDDAIGCTIDVCDEGAGACEHLVQDARCDDGMWCNGAERCSPTDDCVAGAAPDCSDALDCTMDACDEDADECVAPLTTGTCLIEGACYADGAFDGGDFCRECVTSMARDAWTVNCTASVEDDTHADFVQGDFGQSRATAYASADGALRTIQRSDVDGDGFPDLVLVNYYDGATRVQNSAVLRGSAAGLDDPTRRIDLPTVGALSVDVADYDHDGYVDLAFCHHYSDSTHDMDSWVYFGSASGFATEDRVALPTHGCYDVQSADLNRDGWLDLVFANYRTSASYSTSSYVYLGGEDGFSAASRIALPTTGVIGTCLGDLNSDGHVDVLFSSYYTGAGYGHADYIYWGTETGPSPASPDRSLPTLGGRGCSLADLDGDGHLEVIQTNHYNGATGAVTSSVFPGSATGPLATGGPSFPSSWASFTRVADVDGNGFLDLIVPNGYNGSSYATNSTIYFRDGTGFARTESYATVGAYGVAVFDWDGDGYLDVYFPSHVADGSVYSLDSPLFPGTATGPSTTASTTFATIGPQVGMRELGNTFDREFVEHYTSRVFALRDVADITYLDVDATVPAGSEVRVQVRSAATLEGLDTADWTGSAGVGSWHTSFPARLDGIHTAHSFVQYRVELDAPRAVAPPSVEAVRLFFR